MPHELTFFIARPSDKQLEQALEVADATKRLKLEQLVPPPESNFFSRLELFSFYGRIMAYDKAVALCDHGGLSWPFDPKDRRASSLSAAFHKFFRENPALYQKAKSMTASNILLEDDWKLEHWGSADDLPAEQTIVRMPGLIFITVKSSGSYQKAAFEIVNRFPEASVGFLETSTNSSGDIRMQILFVRPAGQIGSSIANFANSKEDHQVPDWRVDPPDALNDFLFGKR